MSKHPELSATLVEKGAAPGRSAYICPNARCVEAAFAKGKLSRALKSQIPDERLAEIKKELICKLQ